ncbi:MAG TPA: 1-deoxy-D-xylulose-5-phosphate reductoisomerase [Myxococcales bacterium]|nr:1-deoxy-D-xylulose-5-phosphate reductoisomerase [Myxococcales bacterium]
MRRLCVLGSTGSVGEQTLAVVADHPERFDVVALAAGKNVARLAEQIERFSPQIVSVADEAGARELRQRIGQAANTDIQIGLGADGLQAVATHPADLVMAALVGAVGLAPTLAAVRAGRDVALANKEVMVMAGALVRREVSAQGSVLLPVDSEHSAIFQALSGQRREDVERLVLTCSGGPFRDAQAWPSTRLAGASREEALDHPNWDMGDKITIDSATLMNKGLEVIEARWLFDVPPDRIDVVVHPQSIVHSLVEYRDTSVMAQLGLPDMRVPIAVALAHPERLALEAPRLDLAAIGRLDFEAPDAERFPCLGLAYRALEGSEAAPAVLNAANEVTVAAFLAGRIAFGAIASTNAQVLKEHLSACPDARVETLDDVLEADGWARRRARQCLGLEALSATAEAS